MRRGRGPDLRIRGMPQVGPTWPTNAYYPRPGMTCKRDLLARTALGG